VITESTTLVGIGNGRPFDQKWLNLGVDPIADVDLGSLPTFLNITDMTFYAIRRQLAYPSSTARVCHSHGQLQFPVTFQ